MAILKLTDLNSSEFKYSLEIYKSSFPPNQTRPIEKVVEMLQNDKNYELFCCLKDSSVVGISLLYTFRSLGIGLLDYLSVMSDYRGQGLGKEIFEATFKKFLSNVQAYATGLLIEVQREDRADNLQQAENSTRKNRIMFYMKMGARILDGVNYLLPPIVHNNDQPEEMYLMIKPPKEIYYLQQDLVIQYLEAIYSTIYQYQGRDLLEKTCQELPKKIMLKNWKL
jgi:GNAT superfamily N-acetyltransferase